MKNGKFAMKKIVFAICAMFLMLGSAHATVISYDLNYEFSGADIPAGPSPWLTATFDDGDTAGSVTLTLESHLVEADSFFGGVYFNFDPDQNAALVDIDIGSTDIGWSSFVRGNDCCRADGSGLYDLQLDFYANTFGDNDTFTLVMTGAGITADMFAYLNTASGDNGLYHVAAHVQGLGQDGLGSGWIGDAGNVPESTTLFLMGLGLLGLGFVRRSKKPD